MSQDQATTEASSRLILPVHLKPTAQYYTDGYRWWIMPEGGFPLGALPAGFSIPVHWIPFTIEEHRRYERLYGKSEAIFTGGYRPTFDEWLLEERKPKQVILPAQEWECTE